MMYSNLARLSSSRFAYKRAEICNIYNTCMYHVADVYSIPIYIFHACRCLYVPKEETHKHTSGVRRLDDLHIVALITRPQIGIPPLVDFVTEPLKVNFLPRKRSVDCEYANESNYPGKWSRRVYLGLPRAVDILSRLPNNILWEQNRYAVRLEIVAFPFQSQRNENIHTHLDFEFFHETLTLHIIIHISILCTRQFFNCKYWSFFNKILMTSFTSRRIILMEGIVLFRYIAHYYIILNVMLNIKLHFRILVSRTQWEWPLESKGLTIVPFINYLL